MSVISVTMETSSVEQVQLSITVEGCFQLGHQDRCILRIGDRTFLPRASAQGTDQHTMKEIFELDSDGEDVAVLEIVNGSADAHGEAAVGVATFSLARVLQAAGDKVQVAVYAAKGQHQVGVLSLSLRRISGREEICRSSIAAPACPFAAASSVALDARTAAPELSVLLAGSAAEPCSRPAMIPQPSPPQQNCKPNVALPPVWDQAAASNAAAPSAGYLPSPFASMPALEPEPLAAVLPSAAPAAVMAAMVAVAAMVAAAAELPATCSLSSPCKGTGSSQPHRHPADAHVASYPRIQPYDTVPPRQFGPGQLPASAGTAAPFYPDIAARIRYSEVSWRLHKLRPTFSAPGAC